MKALDEEILYLYRDEFCCECGARLAEKAGGIPAAEAAGNECGREAEEKEAPMMYLHEVGLQEEYLL